MLSVGCDQTKGLATSNAFVLPADVMSLRFVRSGGADSPSGLYVKLADSFQVIALSRDGANTDDMFEVELPLSAYAGKSVYIEVMDLQESSWGKVAIDNIRLIAGPSPPPPLPPLPPPSPSPPPPSPLAPFAMPACVSAAAGGTLKPVDTAAALGSDSTPRPPVSQSWHRALPLLLGSGSSQFEATRQPSKGRPETADLRPNPLTGTAATVVLSYRGGQRHPGEGGNSYLFYDADCGGHGPGWILGCRRPDTTAASHLQISTLLVHCHRLVAHRVCVCAWVPAPAVLCISQPLTLSTHHIHIPYTGTTGPGQLKLNHWPAAALNNSRSAPKAASVAMPRGGPGPAGAPASLAPSPGPGSSTPYRSAGSSSAHT